MQTADPAGPHRDAPYAAGDSRAAGLQQPYLKGFVLALLLTGWAVKAYRMAHPSRIPVQPISQSSADSTLN